MIILLIVLFELLLSIKTHGGWRGLKENNRPFDWKCSVCADEVSYSDLDRWQLSIPGQ